MKSGEPITIKDIQEYVMWLRHGSPMTPRVLSKLDIAVFAIAQHAEIERMRPVVAVAISACDSGILSDAMMDLIEEYEKGVSMTQL